MKRLSLIPIAIVALFIFSLLSACRKDVATEIFPPDCNLASVFYDSDIEPLMTTYCDVSGCHDNSSAGGIRLRDYEEVKAQSESPQFLDAIKHMGSATPMPLGSAKLTDGEIQTIENWINQGRCE